MVRKFLLLLTLVFNCLLAFGQFANKGTGRYQKQIYWLPWNWSTDGLTGLTQIVSGNNTYRYSDVSKAATFTEGTFTWQLSPYMRIIGQVSGLTKAVNAELGIDSLTSYVNSGLQRMYQNTNTPLSALKVKGGDVKFDLELTFQVYQDGNATWKNIDSRDHGVVFADAESMDNKEFIECYAPSTSNWYLIDKPTAPYSNLSFSNAQYNICVTNDSLNSQSYKKVRITNGTAIEAGATVVMFAKGLNMFKQMHMQGTGVNCLAVGYFINHDPSNATGYDNAMHFQEVVTSSTGGTFYEIENCKRFDTIANISLPGADLTTQAFFGFSPNVLNPQSDSSRNLDALTQANLIKERDNSTTLVYNITYTNGYDQAAKIYAFIDLNKDNVFSNNEAVELVVPRNVAQQSTTLQWPNFNYPAGIYNIRFRITTDVLVDNPATTNIDERAYGLARNGEVTDRTVTVLTEQEYNTALPVTLIDFGAHNTDKGVSVKWVTNDESMISYYHVEKSTNGSDWKVISKVSANNEAVNTYEILDAQKSTTAYYRLAIIENNTTSYSKVVRITNAQNAAKVYPNPTTGILHLQGITDNAIVRIYNTFGAYIGNVAVANQMIDISALESGSYILDINNEQKVQIIKH